MKTRKSYGDYHTDRRAAPVTIPPVLSFVVEASSGGTVGFWEPIAAFNLEGAASNYARECHEFATGKFSYRVKDYGRDKVVFVIQKRTKRLAPHG